MTSGLPLVSIIIVTHNDAALLPQTLAAMRATTYSSYELIFVDNASSDDTVAVLEQADEDLRIIANDVGRGPARANNQGARIARGDYLVFMNPDVYVTPDWLDLLLRHLRERPEVGILAATTLVPGEPLHERAAPVEESAAVAGCAMIVPRRAWDDLEGFEERYFLYWEDTDLCWRAWLRGWRVMIDLHAQVYHDEGGSTGGFNWAGEQIKNGLYTHIKLMSWRRTALFAAQMLGKTVVHLPRATGVERSAMLGAWRWHLRNLPTTLATRRTWKEARRARLAELEPRVVAHSRRGRRDRRELRNKRRALQGTEPA